MATADQALSVRLDDEQDALVILDQTKLPGSVQYISLRTPGEIWQAIKTLQVRGAPAIGITAAFGLYLTTKNLKTEDYDEFLKEFTKVKDYLATSRPTAVNLFWAMNRMQRKLLSLKGTPVGTIKEELRRESQAIRDEDAAMCRAIGENGLSLLRPGMGILTHCNAGAIAVSEYGTALAPVYLGHERGYNFRVFADETRPLLQGARLTAWELHEAGVDVTLVCDGMVSQLMRNGWIGACLVGCDRIASNGDTANKIGTATLAAVAKYYGIPVYVLGPTTTVDMACPTGNDIEIELRDESEISELWYEKRMAPAGVRAYNPAFDVTENELITAIVTEKGVLKPPYADSLAKIMKGTAN